MTNQFPWRTWLKLNGVCLAGVAFFFVAFSAGAALILAVFTILPANALIVIQRARGRLRGDVIARLSPSRTRSFVIPVAVVVIVGAFSVYNYAQGVAVRRVFLVATLSLCTIGGAVALGFWARALRKTNGAPGHADPPEVM
jgi:hypothetical protein